MNREDFPILNKNIIYFDSGATTLKPQILIDETNDYYKNYSANAHRGDYDISLEVDTKYEDTRNKIKDFIGAKDLKEIIFTNNATDSLNKIVFGFFKNVLKKDDEILLTKSEHASNVLPWFELCDQIGCKVRYIELDSNYEVKIENININKNTKVISLAHVTNTIGDMRPIKEISSLAHANNIYLVLDGAQSIPHMKINVQDLDVDFMAFSAHKMLGPTGVGILYGKQSLLEQTKPIIFGGGMNATFNYDGNREYSTLPHCLEAGTPNIAGVIAFGKIIDYINQIGIESIQEYIQDLKKYAIEKLKNIKEIEIYNDNIEGSTILFNYKDIFSQDIAVYLNNYNICVRAGNHCAKILKDEIGIKNTCRISFYLYNTKEEVDRLIEVLNNPNLKDEII